MKEGPSQSGTDGPRKTSMAKCGGERGGQGIEGFWVEGNLKKNKSMAADQFSTLTNLSNIRNLWHIKLSEINTLKRRMEADERKEGR
jgi:hypothetical protein